jgi:hypothetical protein
VSASSAAPIRARFAGCELPALGSLLPKTVTDPGGLFGPDVVAMGTSSDEKTADIGMGKQIGRKLHLEVSTIITSSTRIYRDLRRISCAKRSVLNRDL